MPLASKLFSIPFDDKLEACLASDAGHMTPGSTGPHVRKIQIALNQLNERSKRPYVFLGMDGVYGPRTATAVKLYKDARKIWQPWQTSADKIVGIRTIKSLDGEMDILESEMEEATKYVCLDWAGCQPHDHSKCPKLVDAEQEASPDHKTITHMMTPKNPNGLGRMLCMGGRGEVQYLGFEDAVPDPLCDKEFPARFVLGRLKTSQISSGTVSDVCFRSTPLDEWMTNELRRICMKGARLLFVGEYFSLSNPTEMNKYMLRAKSLGRVSENGTALDPEYGERQWIVVTVDNVDHSLKPCRR